MANLEAQYEKFEKVKERLGRIQIPVGSTVVEYKNIKDRDYIAGLAALIMRDIIEDDKLLAVVKGVCPFPNDCSSRKTCTIDRCNADVCDNGYCYRMS